MEVGEVGGSCCCCCCVQKVARATGRRVDDNMEIMEPRKNGDGDRDRDRDTVNSGARGSNRVGKTT